MKRFHYMFLSAVAVSLFLNGCDSSCCGPVEEKTDPQNNPPVAKINLAGLPASGECTPGNTVNFTSASTDSDGTVTETIWKIDGTVVANPSTLCPDNGETKTICLTAIDNDGLHSQEVCTIIKGSAVNPILTTTPPLSLLENSITYSDGQVISCDNVHDTDTIDTDGVANPYGSDHAIKQVTWEYTYYKAGDVIESGPFIKTQSEYNQDEGKPEGYCQKWFHTYGGVVKIDITLTTLDDDDETNTTKYVFDVATGTLTPQ